MNENGNTYAIGALKRRRAEIDGEIQASEARLRSLNEALCHLDATLALFDPDYDPKTIRAKRRYDRAKLFGGGKLTRLILDALRRSERPLSTAEVIAAIAAEMNFGSDWPASTSPWPARLLSQSPRGPCAGNAAQPARALSRRPGRRICGGRRHLRARSA